MPVVVEVDLSSEEGEGGRLGTVSLQGPVVEEVEEVVEVSSPPASHLAELGPGAVAGLAGHQVVVVVVVVVRRQPSPPVVVLAGLGSDH